MPIAFWPPPVSQKFGGMQSCRKRISQETFDAAVKENMDDFGVSIEEAIQDTIKEFELQEKLYCSFCLFGVEFES